MSLRSIAKTPNPNINSPVKSSEKREIIESMPRLRNRRWIKLLGRFGICLVVFTYVVVPLIARFSPSIHHKFIFLPFVRWPPFQDVKDPAKLGMKGTFNFYVDTEPKITLGAWHILPSSLLEKDGKETRDAAFYENSLHSGHPVILYVHGNAGHRGSGHRMELYRVFQKADVHVIAFDYRGYSDSTPIGPTEDGVVKDSKNMFKWLKDRVGKSPIFVWGHSLGTGVATKMVKELCQEKTPPSGLVLEAPFNNLIEEVRHHPSTRLHRFMPGFDWFFLDPLRGQNLMFETDKHIKGVTTPVIILHAKDDNVVPYELGYKLYIAAKEGRESSLPPVEFISLDGDHNYRHIYIYKAPNLPQIIREFINKWS